MNHPILFHLLTLRLRRKGAYMGSKLPPYGKWRRMVWKLWPFELYAPIKDSEPQWLNEKKSSNPSGLKSTQDVVLYMVSRPIGATAAEIKQIINIKEASIRATISRLRSKNHNIESKKVQYRGTVYTLEGGRREQ